MKKILSKELIIGCSVIVALLILFFGINYLKGINLFKPANFYTVNYDNVAGLETAAAVTIDGYKVGQVRDIEFNYDNPGKIKVTLALNENLRIPEDSRALIESSLLGGPSIIIKLGTSKKMIPMGGEIKGGINPGLMSAVSDDILPQVTDMLPMIDSLMINLNNTAYNVSQLSGHPALAASMKRMDDITGNIAALSGDLRNSLGTQVPGILRHTSSIATSLDTMANNLATLSYQLKNMPIDATMDDVAVVMENLRMVSANLNTLSQNLNNPDGTLGMLMRDPKLYSNLNRVTADIDSLIVDIKRNPKRYISIKLL